MCLKHRKQISGKIFEMQINKRNRLIPKAAFRSASKRTGNYLSPIPHRFFFPMNEARKAEPILRNKTNN